MGQLLSMFSLFADEAYQSGPAANCASQPMSVLLACRGATNLARGSHGLHKTMIISLHLLTKLQTGTSCVREFANKSAASAASPDYVKFPAVIKLAASTPKAKSRKPRPRRSPGGRPGWRMTASGRSASPGSWFPCFGLWGGCASSRLDHGLKV